MHAFKAGEHYVPYSRCAELGIYPHQWRSQDFSYGGAHAREARHVRGSGGMLPQEKFGFQTF